MSERDWPVAPPYREAWKAYHDAFRDKDVHCLPVSNGVVPRHSGAGSGPQITFSGFWIYLTPHDLWATTDRAVRSALTACYTKGGYRSLPEIAAASNADLLDVLNMGQQRLGQLRMWLRRVGLEQRQEAAS